MQPTEKSPGIDSFIETLMGKNRVETIKENLCMTCNSPVGAFRNALSAKEYSISGMCQKCQDSIFGED